MPLYDEGLSRAKEWVNNYMMNNMVPNMATGGMMPPAMDMGPMGTPNQGMNLPSAPTSQPSGGGTPTPAPSGKAVPVPPPPRPQDTISMGQLSSVPDYVARFLVDLGRKIMGLPEGGMQPPTENPAMGLPSGPTQPYLVGEGGPELFTPEVPGQITPISRYFGTPEGQTDTRQGPRVNELGTPLPLQYSGEKGLINRGVKNISDWLERSKQSLADPVGWLKGQASQFTNWPTSVDIGIGRIERKGTPGFEFEKSVFGEPTEMVKGPAGTYEAKPSGNVPAPITTEKLPTAPVSGEGVAPAPAIPMPPELTIPERGPSPIRPTTPEYRTSPEAMGMLKSIYENLMVPRGPVYGYLGPSRGWGMVSGAKYGPKQLAAQAHFADMLERLAVSPAEFEKGVYGTKGLMYGHEVGAEPSKYLASLRAAELPTESYYKRAMGAHALDAMGRPTTVPGGYWLPDKGFVPQPKETAEERWQSHILQAEPAARREAAMWGEPFNYKEYINQTRRSFGLPPIELPESTTKPTWEQFKAVAKERGSKMGEKDLRKYYTDTYGQVK